MTPESDTASSTDPIGQLSAALEQAGQVIDGVTPDQATLPTPCRSWDVRALVNHVVIDLDHFTAMAKGERWEEHQDELVGDDWAGAYRAAADELLSAWREYGVEDRAVASPPGSPPASWSVGLQTADLVVHAWDVARATGQPTDLDPGLGEFALEWGRANLKPEFRGDEGDGKSFGPEVPVAEDAPLYDRVAGYFGRDPAVARS